MPMKFLIPMLLLGLTACEILEEDLSCKQVAILGPAAGAEVRAGEVAFRWQRVEGAAGYELIVASPSFAVGGIVADTVILADTLPARHCGCRMRLGAGKYEWSLAAFNSGYETSAEVRRLTVIPDPAPGPEPGMPTGAAAGAAARPIPAAFPAGPLSPTRTPPGPPIPSSASHTAVP